MSVKQRVYDITTEVATRIARQIADARIQQFLQTQTGNMAKITKVDGNQLTVKLSNGDTRTITNVGGRNLGVGDACATDGKSVAF